MILSAYNEGKKTLFVGVINARARGEGENTGKAPAPVKGSNVFRMLYLITRLGCYMITRLSIFQ